MTESISPPVGFVSGQENTMIGNKTYLDGIIKLLIETANDIDDITGSLNYSAASELSFATDHLRIACARIKSSIGAADAQS